MVKQLSSGDKHKSFMGSDFSYADIAGRRVNQDHHKLIQETDDYFVVESFPKDVTDAYAKIISYIDKKKKVAAKVEYYIIDQENTESFQLLKTLYNKTIRDFNGMYISVESVMKNNIKNTFTILNFSDVEVAVDISDNVMGLKGLQN